MFCDEHGTIDYCPECLKENQWVSVEERLPCMEGMAGESISVIGWFNSSVLPEGDMCFCVYDEEDGFTDEDGDLNEHITHWMPLPEPPTN